jgi:hypothetical protein
MVAFPYLLKRNIRVFLNTPFVSKKQWAKWLSEPQAKTNRAAELLFAAFEGQQKD